MGKASVLGSIGTVIAFALAVALALRADAGPCAMPTDVPGIATPGGTVIPKNGGLVVRLHGVTDWQKFPKSIALEDVDAKLVNSKRSVKLRMDKIADGIARFVP